MKEVVSDPDKFIRMVRIVSEELADKIANFIASMEEHEPRDPRDYLILFEDEDRGKYLKAMKSLLNNWDILNYNVDEIFLVSQPSHFGENSHALHEVTLGDIIAWERRKNLELPHVPDEYYYDIKNMFLDFIAIHWATIKEDKDDN